MAEQKGNETRRPGHAGGVHGGDGVDKGELGNHDSSLLGHSTDQRMFVTGF